MTTTLTPPLANGAPCPNCQTPVQRRAGGTVWCSHCLTTYALLQNQPIDEVAFLERISKERKDADWAERVILYKPQDIHPTKG